MSQEPKKEKKSKAKTNGKARTSQPKAPKKEKVKKEVKQLSSYAEIIEETKRVDIEKPKSFDEFVTLFEAFRKLKDLSNNQIENFFQLIEEKADSYLTSLLAKITVSLCREKQVADQKIIPVIRVICKTRLKSSGILESGLTDAERNVCLKVNGNVVTQFLEDACKQSKNSGQQISNAELASLSFVCFTLYCKMTYNGNPKIQKTIDRAFAEFFSAYEKSGTREKELVGKTIANIMSAKVFSPKKLAELTYLYSGTTELISEQGDIIRNLEETKRTQADRIAYLSAEVKSIKEQNRNLQDQICLLNTEAQQLTEERTAAESMLEYEKNKFEKLLQSQKSGLVDQLTADIALELKALKELVEYLEPDDQKRFRRRLERIDGYLLEFGGGH